MLKQVSISRQSVNPRDKEVLTSVISNAHGIHAPWERSVVVELKLGAVQETSASSLDIRRKDGVIETSSRVVSVNIEIVVVWVFRSRGLEMEFVGVLAIAATDLEWAGRRGADQ